MRRGLRCGGRWGVEAFHGMARSVTNAAQSKARRGGRALPGILIWERAQVGHGD